MRVSRCGILVLTPLMREILKRGAALFQSMHGLRCIKCTNAHGIPLKCNLGDGLPIQFLTQDTNLSVDDQPWPEEDKQKLRDLDFPVWLNRHNHEHVSTLLGELVSHLSQEHPLATISGVGYCFGGKHVLRLAKSSLKAAVAFHPSFVEAEDMDGVQASLYVGLAADDDMVPATLATDFQDWSRLRMKEGVPFTMEIYPGVGHGFAARPDTNDEHIRSQYVRALKATIGFLETHAIKTSS